MKEFKRLSVLIGLTALFFIFLIGLTSCGLADSAGDGYTNAIGSDGNGPGSGKWNPPAPKNENQCGIAHPILETLKANTEEAGRNVMQVRRRCVDEEGKFLPEANIGACTTQFDNKATDLNNHLTDFLAGSEIYAGACNNPSNPLGSRAPSAPDLSFLVPKIGAPLTPLGWHGCLTCTHSLDLEYMYAPFRTDFN